MSPFNIVTVIQIITESLPISSSGHVALYNQLFHVDVPQAWLYAIHLPTIAIVSSWLFAYAYHIRKQWYVPEIIYYGVLIGLIDGITVIFYIIKQYYQLTIPLWSGFACTTILLWLSQYCSIDAKKSSLSIYQACTLGVVQGISLLPGISRFASLFVAMRFMQLSPLCACVMTWLIALPLMGGASLLGLYQLQHSSMIIFASQLGVIVCATIIAAGAFYASLILIQKNRLWWLSLYLVLPSIIAWYFQL